MGTSKNFSFCGFAGANILMHFLLVSFRAVYNAMKKCIIAAMDLNEINERMDKVSAQRKSFDTNRSLCAVVAVFIGYSFYNGIKEGAELWFYIVMPLLIAVAIFLVVFDTKRINQAKAELEELKAAKEAVEADLAELEDDVAGEVDDSESDGDAEEDASSDADADQDDASNEATGASDEEDASAESKKSE